jgi:hypothetical protein
MNANLLARLIAAGTPAELVAEVALELGKAAASEDALARRRAADAQRQLKKRHREAEERMSRDVTCGSVTARDTADAIPPNKKAPHTPKELTPPTPIGGADAPPMPPAGAGRKSRVPRKRKAALRKPGSRLSEDWQPAAVETLPLEIQAIVAQWPKGAYEVTGMQFRNHWLAEGRAVGAKRDWDRTWHNWLIRESAAILRNAKAGMRYDRAAAKAPAGSAQETALSREVDGMRAGETAEALAIRERIRADAGVRTYDGWIRPCAISIDGDEVRITSSSSFMSDWLKENFGPAFCGVAGTVLGRPARVFFEVVKPPDHRAQNVAA